jgi:hypothetical protein
MCPNKTRVLFGQVNERYAAPHCAVPTPSLCRPDTLIVPSEGTRIDWLILQWSVRRKPRLLVVQFPACVGTELSCRQDQFAHSGETPDDVCGIRGAKL